MTQLPEYPPEPRQQAPAQHKVSGMAIAGLILSIAGPCTGLLSAVAGLVLGIVSLGRIGRSDGRITGRGVAIAAIVVGGAWLALLPVLVVAILLPAVANSMALARATVSMNNLNQLSKATMIYAASNEQKFPSTQDWPEQLKPYYGFDNLLRRPGADEGEGRAYAMNAALDGLSLHHYLVQNASRTVLFFECAPGSPPAGGPELLPPEPFFTDSHHIVFVDGHVEAVRPEDVEDLIWNPKLPPTGPPQ